MRRASTILALLLSACPVARAAPKDEAHKVVVRWAEAFNGGRADDVAALYTPDATLWGTPSRTLAMSAEGIRSYFVSALKDGAKVALADDVATQISDHVVVDAGTYVFERSGAKGQKVDQTDRFTFVLTDQSGKWLIAHQHSSEMPVPIQ